MNCIAGIIDPSLFSVNGTSEEIGFEYYRLNLGDQLYGSIAEGLDPIVTNLGAPRMSDFGFAGPQDPDDSSPLNFYLGFFMQTGSGFEDGTFGWVELANDGNGILSVASSATAFEEEGIIVGTLTAIPEPASAMLLGLCSIVALRRRR
ncbi:PEP-CTERM sorting domain-containing protein [Verrucomicrobiaceae bacterium 227]